MNEHLRSATIGFGRVAPASGDVPLILDRHFSRFVLALCLNLTGLGAAITAAADPPVEFETQIAPILQQHCLRCHQPGSEKGGVSLARPEDLTAAGFVVPGDPDASDLLELITAAEGDTPRMPQDAPPLSDQQVVLIRRWIAEGAAWPHGVELEPAVVSDRDWWSLRPLRQPAIPGGDADHPIDAFVDAKLAEHDLVPVEPADPRTLIRRITYDLTGLPPRPEAIQEFLEQYRSAPETAWRDLVDRLLASPAFGEKWARHWLDLARYAETHGYDKDKPRENAWPYRDYVIRSFNEDKPYDRFVREQVAGDVLFPGDSDGVLGLGFLAAGPWDFIGHWEVGEGKLDGRIAKHLDRDEMVSAVFNVFQSTTVGCARCHHHKFDPVQMEDYYRLHAVFAAVDRADRIYGGLTREQQREKRQLVAEISELKSAKQQLETRIEQQLAARVSGIDRRIATLKQQHGATPKPQYGYHSQISKDQHATKWVQLDLGKPRRISRVRLIAAFDQFNDIGAGFGFPVRYRVETSSDPQFPASATRVLLDATESDQLNPEFRPVVAEAGGPPVRFIRVTATKLAERQDDFIFALGELQVIEADSGKNLATGKPVAALDSIESGVRWAAANLTDGIFCRPLNDPDAMRELTALQEKRTAIERAVRTPDVDQRLEKIGTQLRELNSQLDRLPPGKLVYAVATHFTGGGQFVPTEGEPRPIHVLHRGDLESPGERVSPGAPPLWEGAPATFVEGDQWDEGQARAALAGYLTHPENPLLWRSIANRLWQWVFSRPLVGTPNDFGRMGGKPTHPELLDYLAARLRDDPEQSLKSIVRLLVTSRAYRRSSIHHQANSTLDANNAYLWRQNRRRLTAEEFRDSILAVSGALRLHPRGGPSFQDFVVEKPEHSPHYQYHLHDPADPASHRRTIYRFIVRSQPQPMLTALDCADPSISVARRTESTTALQALTQWNNRLVEAMSVRFAKRLRRHAPPTAERRVEYACELALGRPPDSKEHPVLMKILQSEGEAMLARVLMNMSAFTYVE